MTTRPRDLVQPGDRILAVGAAPADLGGDHLATVQDAYAITDLTVAEHRPSLIVMLDGLERLDDVGLAVHTLAAALAPRSCLLLGVPAAAAATIAERCRDAGLTVHREAPADGDRVLLLASPDASPPSRAAV